MYLGVISCLLLIYATNIQAGAGCRLGFSPSQSHFKDKYLNLKAIQWRLPKHPDKEFLTNGQTVTLECGNGFLQHELPSATHTFRCEGGKFNSTYFYEDLLCRNEFHKNVVIDSGFDIKSRLLKCKGQNLETYEVGIRKDDGSVSHLYSICFDKKWMRPKFTMQHPIPSSTSKISRSFSRSDSREDDVWGFDAYGRSSRERLRLSQAYVQNLQQPKMANFEGEDNYPYYFNRGHLVPYSDFADYEEQKATNEYVNIAPQWKEFNKESWAWVEQQARSIRKENPNDWETYTGTYGVITTRRGPAFLSIVLDKRGNADGSFVPVPLMYWKILHNVKDRTKSRVFVGINNPKIKSTSNLKNEYKVCTPVVDPTTKKQFQGNDAEGFVYECQLDDFLVRLRNDEKIVV